MSQASAQREPSMEEILSSIRRIIEDSDTPGDEKVAVDADAGGEKSGPGDEVVEEMDAFLEEFSDNAKADDLVKPEPAGQDNEPTTKEEPVMKDVTPAAKPASSATAMVDEEEPAATERQTPEPALPKQQLDVPAKAEAKDTAASDRLDPAKPKSIEPLSAADVKGLSPAPRSNIEPALSSVPRTEPTPLQGTSAPAAHTQPIVSEKTGRQVQAAFDELNQAFQKSRAKSFDEVAEEMIRPMLQDWLDNNLPTLVEKLVREEIERVARGE